MSRVKSTFHIFNTMRKHDDWFKSVIKRGGFSMEVDAIEIRIQDVCNLIPARLGIGYHATAAQMTIIEKNVNCVVRMNNNLAKVQRRISPESSLSKVLTRYDVLTKNLQMQVRHYKENSKC